MTNPFAILGLPESLVLDPVVIETAWRDLHRDGRDHAGDTASDRNVARAILTDPVDRLACWLGRVDPDGEPERGISANLMDLFARIGPVLTTIDALLTKHRKATTALARAVLAKEAVAAQLAIQTLLQEIQPMKGALTDRFAEFEERARSGDCREAQRALGELKFLKRWEEQCRERLLALLGT